MFLTIAKKCLTPIRLLIMFLLMILISLWLRRIVSHFSYWLLIVVNNWCWLLMLSLDLGPPPRRGEVNVVAKIYLYLFGWVICKKSVSFFNVWGRPGFRFLVHRSPWFSKKSSNFSLSKSRAPGSRAEKAADMPRPWLARRCFCLSANQRGGGICSLQNKWLINQTTQSCRARDWPVVAVACPRTNVEEAFALCRTND